MTQRQPQRRHYAHVAAPNIVRARTQTYESEQTRWSRAKHTFHCRLRAFESQYFTCCSLSPVSLARRARSSSARPQRRARAGGWMVRTMSSETTRRARRHTTPRVRSRAPLARAAKQKRTHEPMAAATAPHATSDELAQIARRAQAGTRTTPSRPRARRPRANETCTH